MLSLESVHTGADGIWWSHNEYKIQDQGWVYFRGQEESNIKFWKEHPGRKEENQCNAKNLEFSLVLQTSFIVIVTGTTAKNMYLPVVLCIVKLFLHGTILYSLNYFVLQSSFKAITATKPR